MKPRVPAIPLFLPTRAQLAAIDDPIERAKTTMEALECVKNLNQFYLTVRKEAVKEASLTHQNTLIVAQKLGISRGKLHYILTTKV